MNVDDVMALVENNPEAFEVKKARLPDTSGKRYPVSIEMPLPWDPKLISEGNIIKSKTSLKLIHDIKLPQMDISHAANLVETTKGVYEIHTLYAHAKQRPSAQITCFGSIRKTDDSGFVGKVTISIDGVQQTSNWVVFYD